MCGIAGVTYRTPAPDTATVLDAMSRRLTHRGPDDQGTHVLDDGSAGIAHRRLSIVDLSPAARQPLLNEDRTLALVCNGEIYNHLDLRRELENKGHRFSSHSDSEVIVHLYEEHGPAMVSQLRGMFAFAILDTRSGELFCARDPLGKKPFYIAETREGLAFGSEIPALLPHPGVDTALDESAVGLFLLRNLRHVPDPLTVYRGVRTLPPGHAMTLRGGQVQGTWRYWRPDLSPDPVTPEAVLEAFDQAVERRSTADVEIGALLSGGVDSTAIVDSLARSGIENMRTYAFGHDAADEELARARVAAERLGTRHTEVHFDAERQHELFDDLLRRHGQPVMALPLTHAMMLFEAIHADGLKVVMAGHGADEVFYGYNGAENLLKLSRLDALLPGFVKRPLAGALAPLFGGGTLGEALRILANPPGRRKQALYETEARRLWPKLMHTAPGPGVPGAWAAPWFDGVHPPAYIDEAAFLGLVQENAHAITLAGDLPAMAHGIEVRCPFMDQDLIEMALRIPYADKITPSADFSGGKMILKKALDRRIPRETLYAPKRGFGYFVQEEMVLRGPWKSRVDAAFAAPETLGGILDADAVRGLKARFDGHDPGVPAILIAKLYALMRFRTATGGAPC